MRSQFMLNKMEKRCAYCHYKVGEGYFTGCRECNQHNSLQARKRRVSVSSDLEDFEADKRRPLTPLGLPKNVRKMHHSASMRVFVSEAVQSSSTEKAEAYLLQLPSASATVASAAPQLPSASGPLAVKKSDREEAEQLLASSAWRRCFVKENNHYQHNLEHDDYDVVFCQRDGDCLFHCFIAILVECGRVNFKMNADPKANVLSMRGIIADFFTQNNNDISFEEFHFMCESIESIRNGTGGRKAYGGVSEIVAFGLKYDISMTVFAPETTAEIITYNPGNIDQGFHSEMLLNTFGWRESGKKYVRNGGTDHWQRVKPKQLPLPQSPLVLVQQEVPLVHVQQQLQSPLVPVQQEVPLVHVQQQQQARKEAAKLRAKEQREADDAASCEQARQFMAAGGRFNFSEPEDMQPARNKSPSPRTEVHLITSGDENDEAGDNVHIHDDAMGGDDQGFAAALDGAGEGFDAATEHGKNDGKRKTTWQYRSGPGYATGVDVEVPANLGEAEDEEMKQGGEVREQNKQGGEGREQNKQGGRKVTNWIHRTRITCLRLIQRLNPFAAKDSGLMWQQIADQIHTETAGITETNARGKTVDCQVHSNGNALMMWYRRQVEELNKSFDAGAEKTRSGQGGMSKKAAASRAEETGNHQDEIEAEWEVVRALKALHDDASRAATMKKQKVQHLKDIKNQIVPDEVQKMACEDQAVRIALITELERRMKKCEQEAKTLTAAGRFAVQTEQQKEEQRMLAEMKQIQKAKRKSQGADSSDGEEDPESGTGGGTTSDARARGKNNNLKLSFDAMTQRISDLSEVMKQDVDQDRSMTLEQVKSLLAGLDDDIKGGLRLEGEERTQVRMIFLKDYAKSKRARLE
jgi:hypothetical protein